MTEHVHHHGSHLPHVTEHHRRGKKAYQWLLVRIALAAVAVGLIATIAVVFAVGMTAPVMYEGSTTTLLPASTSQVWGMLVDVDSLPKRRPEILSVERLPSGESGLLRWKEHTDMGGYMVFSVLEETVGKYLVVRMEDSSFGMTGTWTYDIADAGAATSLTISERSEIPGVFLRALMTATGRDANLRREVQTLREAIFAIVDE